MVLSLAGTLDETTYSNQFGRILSFQLQQSCLALARHVTNGTVHAHLLNREAFIPQLTHETQLSIQNGLPYHAVPSDTGALWCQKGF